MKLHPFRWVLLLAALLLLTGCGLLSGGPTAIDTVTMTDRVDPTTKEAVQPLTNFPAGTTVMYASVLVKNPRSGTNVEGAWYYDKMGNGQFGLIDKAGVTFEQTGNRYVAFSLSAPQAFPKGSYKVTISLDGTVAKEVTFRVE